ncbi:MAG: FtsX-like permease family protein [Candidatus Lokiarchaeota archaeon]|nr:FtsX-like permease family protein [Candidatus Lokiarchaeota archaeon]
MRSKKRFTVFTFMYTAIIIWMSFSLQMLFSTVGTDPKPWIIEVNRNVAIISLVLSAVISISLSVFYAWIITNYRRTEIATLKCIGYTNNNVRVIIVGELIWVTMFSFLIVFELLIHVVAFSAYFYYTADRLSDFSPFIRFGPLLITIALFLVAQIGGILIAYRRVLRLRPIIALRIQK